jgi:methyl-accepting chemotaxis protein
MNLLARLRFSLKLVLVGIVLWVPALFLIAVVLGEHSRDRVMAEQEEKGLRYLEPVRGLLQHLAEHRGMVNTVLMGDTGFTQEIAPKQAAIAKDIEALEALEAQYGREFRSAEPWRRVMTGWDGLKAQALALRPGDSFERHTAILVDLQDLMAYVADTSGLILDSERESAHLVDIAVFRSPVVGERLGVLRGKATGFTAKGSLTSEQKAELIGGLAVVRDALGAIDERLRLATESGIGAAGRIAAVREELVTKSRSFTELVDVKVLQAPEGAPIEVKPAQVFTAGSEAVAAAFKLADTASASLGTLLGERVEHLRHDQYVTLAQALCLMLAGVALGFAVTRDMERSAAATAAVASAIAKGDLTSTIKVIGRDEGAWLLHELKTMQKKLIEVTIEVRRTAVAVYSGARQIVQGNTDLSSRTEEQASSLEETASSMEEFTGTVRQNANNAREANQLSSNARQQAERGGAVVHAAIAAMAEINTSAKRIADIIGVIDEIAFQTNLLALNAAVEAARAGEQGRGFAVVASEVRNLAQRSAGAAKEIKGLIQDSVRKVEDGSKLVDQSGAALGEIVSSVKQVSDMIAEIAAASQEQSSGIEQVNRAISQMDQATQQNAALVEEAAAASESMEEQANHLTEIMAFFQLQETAATSIPERIAHAPVAVERRTTERPWSGTPSARPKTTSSPAKVPAQRVAVAGGDGKEWEEF